MDLRAIQYQGKAGYEIFVDYVRKFGTENALMGFGQFAMRLEKSGGKDISVPSDILGRREVISLLALTLILHSNDYRKHNFSENDLKNIGGLYYNILEDPFSKSQSDPPSLEEAIQALIRMSYEQIASEASIVGLFGRTVLMYLDFDDNPDFNMNAEFTEIYGISIEDFISTGMFLYLSSIHHDLGIIHPQNINQPLPFISKETLAKFLEVISANYQKFREFYQLNPLKSGYEKFELNLLRTFPLVRTERHRYVTFPVPSFFYERFTKGIFHDLRKRFDKGGQENEFTTFFGRKVFERYVGYLLNRLYPKTQVIKEIQYGSSDTRTSDWIFIEGNDVVLIECKTSCLTLKSKSYADQATLLKD